MNISRLTFQFFIILITLTITPYVVASTNANILEDEEKKITYIDKKLESLLLQDKVEFTEAQWKSLATTRITIALKEQSGQSSRRPREVNAEFYKEKFLEQFINGDINLEDPIINISYPYKFRCPFNQAEKYKILIREPYTFATSTKTEKGDITIRYFEGNPGNFQLKYLKGQKKKTLPHFLTDEVLQDINDYELEKIKAKLSVSDDVHQFVHKDLYEDCSYYEVISGKKGESKLRNISFENPLELQDKLKLTIIKNDNTLWLTTVLTEKFVDGNSAYLMLKTPFEIVERHEIINERIGTLGGTQDSYEYLELPSLENNKAILKYLDQQDTPCSTERGIDQPLPTVVKLYLGVNSKEKWNEYLTTSPIKNREKYPEGTLRNQVNSCNYVSLMGDALKQNSMIRTVEVYTDSLTPSLYNTLKEWRTQLGEVFISPFTSGEFRILNSQGEQINNLYYRNRIEIDSLYPFRILDLYVWQTDQLYECEHKHDLIQKLSGYKIPGVSSRLEEIYLRVAQHCFDKKKVIQNNELQSISKVYGDWLEKTKINAINKLKEIEAFRNLCSPTINIKSEYLLQAIFFANLRYSNSFLKDTTLLKEYSKYKSSIKFNLDLSYKLKTKAKEITTGAFLGGILAGGTAIAGIAIGGPIGLTIVAVKEIPIMMGVFASFGILGGNSDANNTLKAYQGTIEYNMNQSLNQLIPQ